MNTASLAFAGGRGEEGVKGVKLCKNNAKQQISCEFIDAPEG